MKKYSNLRVFSILLVLCVVLPSLISACKKTQSASASDSASLFLDEDGSEDFFQCENVELIIPTDASKELKQLQVHASAIIGDSVVVACNLSYEYPPELQAKLEPKKNDSGEPEEYDPEEWAKIMDEMKAYSWNGLVVFDMEGKILSSIELKPEETIYSLWEGPEREILALGYFENGNSLVRIHSDKAPEILIPFDSMSIEDATYLDILENGSYFISNMNEYGLWNSQGQKVFVNPSNGVRSVIFEDGEKWYVTVCEHNEDYTQVNTYIQEIDIHTGKLDAKRSSVDEGIVNISVHGQDGYYGVGNDGVRKLYPAQNKSTMVLRWKNTNVNYTQIRADSLTILSEDQLCFLTVGKEHDPNSGWYKENLYLTCLTRQKDNHMDEKTTVTIGTLNGSVSASFLDVINLYNADPNSLCRVEVVNLSENMDRNVVAQVSRQAEVADQIYLNMLNGEGSDILCGFYSFSQFDTDKVLCDMNDFIDGSNGLDRSKCFDSAFRALERQGKLYQMPLNFILYGVLVNGEYINETTNWDFESFQAIENDLPDDVSFLSEMEYAELLRSFLGSSFRELVDYDSQQVFFDSESFRELLQTVKQYGCKKKSGEYYPIIDKLDEGMLALYPMPVSTVETFSEYMHYCDGKMIYTGWPTSSGGGACVQPNMSLAISRFSVHKEEAWDFIKYCFSEDVQYKLMFDGAMESIPLDRASFLKTCDEAILRSQRVYDDYEKHKEEYINGGFAAPYLMSSKDVDALVSAIENARAGYSSDPFIMSIILEEAPAYFENQKSLDEVCSIIQDRASIYVQEK